MKLCILIFFTCISLAFGLTPAERKVVLHAQSHLRAAIHQFEEAQLQATQAQAEANAADDRAVEANRALATAERAVDVAHKREVSLGADNQKMRPVYERVQKFWGIGGIFYGFQLLARHLLVLAVVLIVLGIALSILSKFFPVIGVAFAVVVGFFKRIFRK